MSFKFNTLRKLLASLNSSGQPGGRGDDPDSTTCTSGREIKDDSRSAIGSRFGSYVLRELLGSGGMGQVYLAEHQLLGRHVAIKLIRPERNADPSAIARFESEARATAQLTHPNTVEIYDYGITDDGTLYYVMEFLPGLNLQEIVERTGPMSAGRVIHLLRQACSALHEAHQQGLVHRDIKPANLVATRQGGVADVLKVLDFGLVKFTQNECSDMHATHDGILMGSPLYAAPELIRAHHEVDARTDIYSLGATAYHLLSGRPVFSGGNALAVMFAHANDPAPQISELNPEISPELEAIVLKCLAKRPDDRFASVADLEQALAACAERHPWTSADAAEWWQGLADFDSQIEKANVDVYSETAVVPRVAA